MLSPKPEPVFSPRIVQAIGIFVLVSVVTSLGLAVYAAFFKPDSELSLPPPYEPLTLEVVLDPTPVSLAGGFVPVQVDICNTEPVQLLVHGSSTYVQADAVDRPVAITGLSAEIVMLPATAAEVQPEPTDPTPAPIPYCQSLGRALPLGVGMNPGLWYMNLVVSVIDKAGKAQFINQRTPDFQVVP